MKRKLFLFFIMMFVMIPFVHAASVTRIDDINNAPTISGRKSIYITDAESYTININDTANFKKIGSTAIVIYNKPTKDTAYTNPFSITYKNAGYYINDNGDAVYVNVIISVTKLFLDMPTDSYSDNADHYHIANANIGGFHPQMYARDSDNEQLSMSPYMANHMWISFKVTNADGSDLDSSIANNMVIPWTIYDLDIRDRSANASDTGYASSDEYRESIKFTSGFNSTFYVLNGSVLDITDSNTKYSATETTGNDNGGAGQKGKEYSTVVGYQISPTATAEWWGTACGTGIYTRAQTYNYPDHTTPKKSTSQYYYRIGSEVSYTVTQKFPKTIAANKATKIEIVDEFDDAFDITNITYQVLNNSGTNVTSKWKKTVSGNKITLTYNGSDTTEVVGTYKFIFNKLKVLEPSSSHTTINEDQVNYKIVPNKAKLNITSSKGTTTSEETNNVDVKVYYSNLELIKEVTNDEYTDPKVGDRIEYKFKITNYGGSKLTELTLTDEMEGIVIDKGMQDTLESGETITVYGHYSLTEEDIKNGNVIINTATVTGKDPSGNILRSKDKAVVEIIVNPKTGTRNYVVLVIELLVCSLAFCTVIARKSLFK